MAVTFSATLVSALGGQQVTRMFAFLCDRMAALRWLLFSLQTVVTSHLHSSSRELKL